MRDANALGHTYGIQANGRLANLLEQPPPPAEQNRDDVHLELVECAAAQPLLYGSTAMQSDVPATRGSRCSFEGRIETFGDEVKRRSFTDVIGTSMVGEHKERYFEWRTETPCRLGVVVTVTPHHHRAQTVKLRAQDIVGGQLVPVGHIMGKPAVERFAADAHRVFR